jgi:hypothetical protein
VVSPGHQVLWTFLLTNLLQMLGKINNYK